MSLLTLKSKEHFVLVYKKNSSSFSIDGWSLTNNNPNYLKTKLDGLRSKGDQKKKGYSFHNGLCSGITVEERANWINGINCVLKSCYTGEGQIMKWPQHPGDQGQLRSRVIQFGYFCAWLFNWHLTLLHSHFMRYICRVTLNQICWQLIIVKRLLWDIIMIQKVPIYCKRPVNTLPFLFCPHCHDCCLSDCMTQPQGESV